MPNTKLLNALISAGNKIALKTSIPQQAIDFLDLLDFSGIEVSNYKEETKPQGTLITFDLPVLPQGEILIPLPNMPGISLVIEPAIINQNPSIKLLAANSAASYLEVDSLMIALRFDTDLLRPANGTHHAELQFAANLRFYKNWKITFADAPSLSLLACEIFNSGMIISLRNLKFQVSREILIPEIAALNLPDSFRGVYAKKATLQILKDHFYEIDSVSNLKKPGINIEFEDVAIGNTGFTFSAAAIFSLISTSTNTDFSGELTGNLLFDSIKLGISKVTIKVFTSEFSAFSVEGMIRLHSNFINTLFDFTIGFKKLQGNNLKTTLAIKTVRQTEINFGTFGYISFSKLTFDGFLEKKSFEIAGTIENMAFHLNNIASNALSVSASEIQARIKYSETINSFHAKVDVIRLGAFGEMSGEFSAKRTLTANEPDKLDIAVSGNIKWHQIKEKLNLQDPFKSLLLIGDDFECKVSLVWEKGSTANKVKTKISVKLPDNVKLNDLIEPLPDYIKLETRNLCLSFETDYSSTDTGTTVDGKYTFVFEVKLPELPEFLNMVKVKSGNNDGWMTAELAISASVLQGTGKVKVDASILNPVSADFFFPGIEQTEAPVHIQIGKIKAVVEAGSRGASAAFEMTGNFKLKAIEPPIDFLYKEQLEKLLNPVLKDRMLEGSSTVKFALAQSDSGTSKWNLDIVAELKNASVELDIVRFFEEVLRGAASTVSEENIPHLPIDLKIGCKFKGFHFQVPDLTGGSSNVEKFKCEFTFEISFGDSDAIECKLSFSNKSFSVMIKGDIPLKIPSLPMQLQDLHKVDAVDFLLTDADWENKLKYYVGVSGIVQDEIVNFYSAGGKLEQLQTEISDLEELIDNAIQSPDSVITDVSTAVADARLAQYVTNLKEKTEEFNNTKAKVLVLNAIQKTIIKMAHSEGGVRDEHLSNRHIFMNWMKKVAQGAGYFNDVTSKGFPYFSLDRKKIEISDTVKLHIDAEFTFDYYNKNNIGLKGNAWLKGLHADDLLKPLFNDDDNPLIKLDIGLGADTIYFSLSTAADGIAVKLPFMDRYDGGKITIAKFFIGFGYTKRSLAVVLDGSVELPGQFVDDLNTTRQLGIGVKLPDKVQVYFRFDLIPVPVIKVLPYFEFKFDLRRDFSPGIRDTKNCLPNWDGLEFHLPGIYETDFKYLIPNFMHGPFAAPSLSYAFDEKVGNDINGYTIIVDNLKLDTGIWMYPTWWDQVPFFCSLFTPSFDNICFNLRLAGFGINFDLQRPFPSFSIMALLELMGLISDPQSKINPDGDLANSIRITVRDTYLVIPGFLRKMFPQLNDIHRVEVNKTLNMATLLPFFQKLFEISNQGFELAKRTINNPEDSLETIIENIRTHISHHPQHELIKYLPPEMRMFSVGASFGGFEADATLIFATLEEAKQKFSERTNPTPGFQQINLIPQVTLPDFVINPDPGIVLTADQQHQLDNIRKNYEDAVAEILIEFGRKIIPSRLSVGSNNFYDPKAASENLFKDVAFSKFDIEDFGLISADDNKTGVIGLANLKVIDALKIHFMGSIFEDGSFTFVSTSEVSHFTLNIPWINLPITVNIAGTPILKSYYDTSRDEFITVQENVNKLFLKGNVTPLNPFAVVTANIGFSWKVLPCIIEFNQINAAIKINSNGRFSISGSGVIDLFDGKAKIVANKIFINESYCSFEGTFTYSIQDILDLRIHVNGSVGPHAHFKFSGTGNLALLGKSNYSGTGAKQNAIKKAFVSVTETGAEISFGIHGNMRHWFHIPNFIQPDIHIETDLKGYIDFPKGVFSLQGATVVKIPAHANIPETELVKGSCIFEYKYSHFKFITFGDINLFGTPITSGKLEISNNYFNVEGDLKLSLPEDLGNIPEELKVTINNLPFYPFLNLNAKCGFYFNLFNTSNFKFKGNYDLGIRNGANAVFSILKGNLPEESVNLTSGEFHIPGFATFGGGNLLPFNKISIGFPPIKSPTANRFLVFATAGLCFKIYLRGNGPNQTFIENHAHGWGDHPNDLRWNFHDFPIYNPPSLDFNGTPVTKEFYLPNLSIPAFSIGLKWDANSKTFKLHKQ